MPVDRQLYNEDLTKTRAPNWPCPTCGGGHYRINKGSFNFDMDSATRESVHLEWFGPEHYSYKFVVTAECDNDACKEFATIAGVGRVEEYGDWETQKIEYFEKFQPKYFSPSPRLITIPKSCPSEIIVELDKAFTNSWEDYSSSGNHLRSAVERLLDDLKIKASVVKRNKRTRLSLHDRIVQLQTTLPEIHDFLLAIKWMGNAGSHADNLSRDQLFDAFDVFEEVLRIIYAKHPNAVRKIVKAVNLKRGPINNRNIF